MNTLTSESLSFWPHLTRQQQETLLNCVQRASYAPGQIIRSPDTDCLGALLIQSGVVRIYLLSEDGREATISRMTEGEVCVLSASCMLNAITFDVQIQAETAVEVLVIPIQYLSVLMRENIYVENFIYKAAAQRFSHAIRAVEQMLFYTLEQRVASYLLEESQRLETDTIQFTQEQLAQAIGSAREAVTRTLKKRSAAETVELFRGGVCIRDRKGLERLVERGGL